MIISNCLPRMNLVITILATSDGSSRTRWSFVKSDTESFIDVILSRHWQILAVRARYRKFHPSSRFGTKELEPLNSTSRCIQPPRCSFSFVDQRFSALFSFALLEASEASSVFHLLGKKCQRYIGKWMAMVHGPPSRTFLLQWLQHVSVLLVSVGSILLRVLHPSTGALSSWLE